MRRTRKVTKKVKIKEKVCISCGKILTIFEEAYLDHDMCYGCDALKIKQQKLL